jgi:predicted tellurium resistance membrane protein TerC
MDWITQPEAWIGFATLTLLEIVLGIDNIVFISILTDRLPRSRQARARLIGLALAMLTRILLLFSLTWIIQLTAPLFVVLGEEISGRDLVLIIGGLFLLAKSTHEIHGSLEGSDSERPANAAPSFLGVLIQIMLLDIVFSLDSVITAVGMVDDIGVMVSAVIVAVGFMMLFAGSISRFVSQHPTIKMLALSFLIMIGIALIAEGLDQHIPKGYIYFAMAFSVAVELLNLRVRRGHTAVKLRRPYETESATSSR